MPAYTVYKTATGEITGDFICPEQDISLNVEVGEAYVDGSYSAMMYYVPNGVPTEKTLMSPVVSGWTISNLPTPCTVYIDATSVSYTHLTLPTKA